MGLPAAILADNRATVTESSAGSQRLGSWRNTRHVDRPGNRRACAEENPSPPDSSGVSTPGRRPAGDRVADLPVLGEYPLPDHQSRIVTGFAVDVAAGGGVQVLEGIKIVVTVTRGMVSGISAESVRRSLRRARWVEGGPAKAHDTRGTWAGPQLDVIARST